MSGFFLEKFYLLLFFVKLPKTAFHCVLVNSFPYCTKMQPRMSRDILEENCHSLYSGEKTEIQGTHVTRSYSCWQRISSVVSINKDVTAIKPSPTATALRVHPEEKIGWRKAGMCQESDFNELSILSTPIHRKALKSLTLSVSGINSNLLMFYYFFIKNSYMSWLLSYVFGTVHHSCQRGSNLGLSSQ